MIYSCQYHRTSCFVLRAVSFMHHFVWTMHLVSCFIFGCRFIIHCQLLMLEWRIMSPFSCFEDVFCVCFDSGWFVASIACLNLLRWCSDDGFCGNLYNWCFDCHFAFLKVPVFPVLARLLCLMVSYHHALGYMLLSSHFMAPPLGCKEEHAH